MNQDQLALFNQIKSELMEDGIELDFLLVQYISLGGDVNYADNQGNTLIKLAQKAGKNDFVQTLQAQTPMSAPPQYSAVAPQPQYTVLPPAYSGASAADAFNRAELEQQIIQSIKAGDESGVMTLLRNPAIGPKINNCLAQFENKTLLHIAADNKQTKIVELLVTAGADPTVCTPTNHNALHAAFSVESNAETILYLLSMDHYRQTLMTELAAVPNGFKATPFITTIAQGHEQNIQAMVQSKYAQELLSLSIGNDPHSTDIDTSEKAAARVLAHYTQKGDQQAILKFQRIASLLKSIPSALNLSAQPASSVEPQQSVDDLKVATTDEKNEAIQARLYNLVLDRDVENIATFLKQENVEYHINEPILEAVMESERDVKDLFLTFFVTDLDKDTLRKLLIYAYKKSNREFIDKINGLLDPNKAVSISNNNSVSTSSLMTPQYAAPVFIAPPANSTYSMTPVQLSGAMGEFSSVPPPLPLRKLYIRKLYVEVTELPTTNNNRLPGSSVVEPEKKKGRRLEPA